jgi:hypothetical protein
VLGFASVPLLVAAACDSTGTIVASDASSDARTFDAITFDGPTLFEAAPPHEAGPSNVADAGDGA